MDCTIEDQQSKTSKPPTTSVVRTRQSVSHAVFGSPAPLPTNVLPTNGDVGRYFLYCKERSNAGNESVFKAVTTEIIQLCHGRLHRSQQFSNNLFTSVCLSSSTRVLSYVGPKAVKKMGLALQWFICLLHTNELPLRHLFQKLDRQTSGSTTFSGPIGKAIQSCEGSSIVDFKPIVGGSGLPDMPKEVIEDLSRD